MILGQAPSMQYRISRTMVYTLFGRANALHTGYWVSINATPQRSFLLCEWTLYSAKKRTTCLNGHIFIVWEKYQTTDPKLISDYIFPNVFLHCQPQSARMSKSGCNITDALETKFSNQSIAPVLVSIATNSYIASTPGQKHKIAKIWRMLPSLGV